MTKVIHRTKRGRVNAAQRESTKATVVGLVSDMYAAFDELYAKAPGMTSGRAKRVPERAWAKAISGLAAGHMGLYELMQFLGVDPTTEQEEQSKRITSFLAEIETPTERRSATALGLSDHEKRVQTVIDAANARRPELGLS
ncbi:MAG: hypothetical protein IH830_03050 [Planctomycetes bacterium]|nr:hypothetical protein [Planctomycetota bacterium]